MNRDESWSSAEAYVLYLEYCFRSEATGLYLESCSRSEAPEIYLCFLFHIPLPGLPRLCLYYTRRSPSPFPIPRPLQPGKRERAKTYNQIFRLGEGDICIGQPRIGLANFGRGLAGGVWRIPGVSMSLRPWGRRLTWGVNGLERSPSRDNHKAPSCLETQLESWDTVARSSCRNGPMTQLQFCQSVLWLLHYNYTLVTIPSHFF